LKHTLAAAAALGAVALAPGSASAMPNGLPSISGAVSSNVENVRWVCGPYRCWRRPNWYGAYGYHGGPRRWWGLRHRWHNWRSEKGGGQNCPPTLSARR